MSNPVPPSQPRPYPVPDGVCANPVPPSPTYMRGDGDGARMTRDDVGGERQPRPRPPEPSTVDDDDPAASAPDPSQQLSTRARKETRP